MSSISLHLWLHRSFCESRKNKNRNKNRAPPMTEQQKNKSRNEKTRNGQKEKGIHLIWIVLILILFVLSLSWYQLNQGVSAGLGGAGLGAITGNLVGVNSSEALSNTSENPTTPTELLIEEPLVEEPAETPLPSEAPIEEPLVEPVATVDPTDADPVDSARQERIQELKDTIEEIQERQESQASLDASAPDTAPPSSSQPNLSLNPQDVQFSLQEHGAITIDSTLYAARFEDNPSPNVVFINKSNGYVFYDDGLGVSSYRKTTDRGETWSAATALTPDMNPLSMAVWYDRWTPSNGSGNFIRIVGAETINDSIWYKSLNTADDSVYPAGDNVVVIFDGDLIASESTGGPTITRTLNGSLFVAGCHGGTCSSWVSGTNGSSWTNTTLVGSGGINPDDLDGLQMFPLPSNNSLLVMHDESAHDLLSKMYNATSGAWDTTWAVSDGSFSGDTVYDEHFGGSLYKVTGDVFVAGVNNVSHPSGDVVVYRFNATTRTWANLTNVINNFNMTDARVIVNESNGDLFVTYLRGEPSAYTYPLYKKSTDGGATWSVESKRLYNESGDDFKQIKTNFMSNATFFAVWYNDDIDDIYGYVVNSTLSAGNYFVNETLIDDLIISSSFFDQNSPSPGMVFINETHGYAFYTDSGGDIRYKKTTNGGADWTTQVDLSGEQSWRAVSVWYDQWTPGNTTGTRIHIVASHAAGGINISYKQLDTSDDSLTPATTFWTLALDINNLDPDAAAQTSITMATDGMLYIIGCAAEGLGGGSCNATNSSNNGATWSASTFLGAGQRNVTGDDPTQIFPLAKGNILVVSQDLRTGNTNFSSRMYNRTSGSWDSAWTTFDPNFVGSLGIITWGGTLDKSTNDIYITGVNDTGNVRRGDIRAYKFTNDSRTWSNLTTVTTSSAGYNFSQAIPVFDQTRGTLWAIYTNSSYLVGPAPRFDITFKNSTNGGVSWSAPVTKNLHISDFPHLRSHFMSPGIAGSEIDRIYAMWFDETNSDIIGSTIATSQIPNASCSTSADCSCGENLILTPNHNQKNLSGSDTITTTQCTGNYGLQINDTVFENYSGLNCTGRSIKGVRGSGTIGLRIRNVSNFTLRGCVISSFETGLFIQNARNIELYNLTVTNSTRFGIFLQNVSVVNVSVVNLSNHSGASGTGNIVADLLINRSGNVTIRKLNATTANGSNNFPLKIVDSNITTIAFSNLHAVNVSNSTHTNLSNLYINGSSTFPTLLYIGGKSNKTDVRLNTFNSTGATVYITLGSPANHTNISNNNFSNFTTTVINISGQGLYNTTIRRNQFILGGPTGPGIITMQGGTQPSSNISVRIDFF